VPSWPPQRDRKGDIDKGIREGRKKFSDGVSKVVTKTVRRIVEGDIRHKIVRVSFTWYRIVTSISCIGTAVVSPGTCFGL
jgi:hypothetical protein